MVVATSYPGSAGHVALVGLQEVNVCAATKGRIARIAEAVNNIVKGVVAIDFSNGRGRLS